MVCSGAGFTACGKIKNFVIPRRAARRGISLSLAFNHREIPRFAQNDKMKYFFRSLLEALRKTWRWRIENFAGKVSGRVYVYLFLAKNFFPDIRPEFLEDVIQDRRFHLRSPVQSRLTQAALLRRIVEVGQAGFHSISSHLGPVEG